MIEEPSDKPEEEDTEVSVEDSKQDQDWRISLGEWKRRNSQKGGVWTLEQEGRREERGAGVPRGGDQAGGQGWWRVAGGGGRGLRAAQQERPGGRDTRGRQARAHEAQKVSKALIWGDFIDS